MPSVQEHTLIQTVLSVQRNMALHVLFSLLTV